MELGVPMGMSGPDMELGGSRVYIHVHYLELVGASRVDAYDMELGAPMGMYGLMWN